MVISIKNLKVAKIDHPIYRGKIQTYPSIGNQTTWNNILYNTFEFNKLCPHQMTDASEVNKLW